MSKIAVIHVTDGMDMNWMHRLDDPKTPERFFHDVITNWEIGEKITISAEELTPEQWAEAERIGEEMS